MGIIIFPFLLSALIIFVICIIKVIKGLINKEIDVKQVAFGLLLSLLIYAGIFIDYLLSESAYAFGPLFYFPFAMVYIPLFVAVGLKAAGRKMLVARRVLYCSIVLSGLFIMIFYNYTLGLAEYLDIPKTY